MAKKITLRDIAKELGLSPSTVSLALKDFPGISEDTQRGGDGSRLFGHRSNETHSLIFLAF